MLGNRTLPHRTARHQCVNKGGNHESQLWAHNPKTHIIRYQNYICIYAHSVITKQLQQRLQGFERRQTGRLSCSAGAVPGGQRSQENLSGDNTLPNTCVKRRSLGTTSFVTSVYSLLRWRTHLYTHLACNLKWNLCTGFPCVSWCYLSIWILFGKSCPVF